MAEPFIEEYRLIYDGRYTIRELPEFGWNKSHDGCIKYYSSDKIEKFNSEELLITILNWKETEHGKWCIDHTIDFVKVQLLVLPIGYVISLYGHLSLEDQTYYFLKWRN
jgi:hypothetical protein